mgnify:CR=1 FL=1
MEKSTVRTYKRDAWQLLQFCRREQPEAHNGVEDLRASCKNLWIKEVCLHCCLVLADTEYIAAATSHIRSTSNRANNANLQQRRR